MALQKEVWQSTIVDNLYPDNSFAVKSVDDSEFVDNKTVHIPNAGAASKVQKNRTTKPAAISQRTDNDLSYDMDELTTDPVYIPNIEVVQFSYNKRESIVANDRRALQDAAHVNLLGRWGKAAEGSVLLTTGTKTEAAHTSSSATGSRKAITKADVFKLMRKFDSENVPEADRYLLLDAYMYSQLLEDLTESDKMTFLASANAQTGVVGMLAGFNIMKRSQVLRLSSNKTILGWDSEGAAGELAAGLAWQKESVSRAIGEFKMFEDLQSPTYYGDIYSFLVMTGGACRRYDKKGIALIAEVPAS